MTPSARFPGTSARGLLIALTALACAGCSMFQMVEPDTAHTDIRLLSGDELILDEGSLEPLTWITPRHALRLNYQPAASTLPAQLVFVYRARGDHSWLLGPTWSPGQGFPEWIPPAEGAWELRAHPFAGNQPRAPLAEAPAHGVVICDWTPPRVRIEEALPATELTGGGRVVLRWHAEDDYPGAAAVELEVAQGLNGEWQPVGSMSNSGLYEWDVPNRPLVSARVRLRVVDAAGNSTEQEIPGRLTVHSLDPRVELPALTEVNADPVQLPYEVQLNHGLELTRVELWITRDGGASWNLAAYDHDLEPPFELRLDEGRYGITVVAEDSAGNRSTYPAPGDTPMGLVLVDWTAPRMEWGEARVRPVDQTDIDGTPLLDVRLPYRVIDDALDAHELEFSYRAGAGDWVPIDGEFGLEGSVNWRVPPQVVEPVFLRARGSDQLGNGFSAETRVYPREILDPPTLELVEAPSGWIRGGDAQVIRWRASWEWAADDGVSLSYRVAENEPWQTLASGLPVTEPYTWQVPEVNLDHVELRITLRSTDDRELATHAEEKIHIDADAPEVRLLGPTSGHGDATSMLVEAEDRGGSEIDTIELYARRQGSARWSHVGSVAGDTDSIVFRPPAPGIYDLWPVATDHAGNQSVLPELVGIDEAFAFRAEVGPPGVELENFQDGGRFAGGSRHPVFVGWRGPTALGGIAHLQYSADDGATWHDIGRFQLGAERYVWTLPKQDIARCRLRVIAREVTGRRTVDMSTVSFAVDISAPTVPITGIIDAADDLTTIQFGTPEGDSGDLTRVWLYTTRDGGRQWDRWDEPFAPDAPITVQLPAGEYGLALRGEDLVGNVGDPPLPGEEPPVFARVGTLGGAHLALVNPRGGSLGGGTRHYIFWHLEVADVPFAERPVTLEYRVDGAADWLPIADSLPREGKEAWTVPELEGASVELRAVALDLRGNRYEDATEEAILVDSEVPLVLYAGPASSNRHSTRFEYRLAEPDTLAAVELWLRAVSTPEWKLITVAPIGQPLRAEIADGMYRVALVGVDMAGNRGEEPSNAALGQSDLLVDTVPPLLHVDATGERRRVFREREWFTVRPRVQDRHTSPFPLSFRYSGDAGAHFTPLKRYHPNGEEFSWRLPDRAGFYQLEVTAEDLAGNKARQVIPVQVVATAPTVTLLTDPGSSVLMGGSDLRLEWESAGVDPIHPGVTIEFSSDGMNWEQILDGLPADGSTPWKLPEVDSNRCRVRVVLEREDGLTGHDQSAPFTISTTPPRVRVEDIRPSPQEE